MTKFGLITYTPAQAQALVDVYNQSAKSPLSADKAHLIFHDNSDDEMAENGYTHIEIGAFETKSGRPHTYEISRNEVTFD